MSTENKIETNVVKPRLSIFQDENEYRLISYLSEMTLDMQIAEVENYIKSNHGSGKEEWEKDELYAEAKRLWTIFTEELKHTNYTFYLNKKQHQYILTLLRDKLEYDVNTVFLAIELTNMLGEWYKSGSSDDEKSLKGYESDATEVTYMYHLIAKHSVKGLTSGTYLFSEILRKIGEISKIVSYYDTHAKSLFTEITKWVASFDDGVPVGEGKLKESKEVKELESTKS